MKKENYKSVLGSLILGVLIGLVIFSIIGNDTAITTSVAIALTGIVYLVSHFKKSYKV